MATSKRKVSQGFNIGDIIQGNNDGIWENAYYILEIIEGEIIIEAMGEHISGGKREDLKLALMKKYKWGEDKLANLKRYTARFTDRYRCGDTKTLTEIIKEGKLRIRDKRTLINELADEIYLTLGDLN